MRRLRFESLLPSLEARAWGFRLGTHNVNNNIHDTEIGKDLVAPSDRCPDRGRGKSELHRAGCLAKAGEGPVVGLDSPHWRPLRRARATETNATRECGVKRAILPAAISESTAASSRTLGGWTR